MARPRRSEPVTIVEHRAKSRSEQATRKIAEHRAKAREESDGASRRRASAKDFAAQVRSQHAAMFRRDPPEEVRLKRRNCLGVSTTEAQRKIPQSSSSSGRRAAARGDTAAGGATPNGTRSGEEHVATSRSRKKRTVARQDLKSDRGSRHRGTPASTGRQTKRPALQNKQKNIEIMRRAFQKLKQNHQRAVLRRTRDSSAERGSTTIGTVGSTDGGIPCIRQEGAHSREGSPRSRATSSAARGANMLHATSENSSAGSERSSGSSDVSDSERESGGGVETGVPRNAVLEEMLPFIVESLKRIELRLHSLERRCDGFSEAFHELKAALSTRHQSHREEEHVPSAATPLPGIGSGGNCQDRSLPTSTMQSHSRNDKEGRSPSAITDHTRKGLPPKGVTSALQPSESPSPTIKPCASSLGVPVGSAQNVEAVDTASPRVSVAMRSRGMSNPVHSILSPDSVEVPVAPIADHLMPGVTNTDASGQVLPPIRKDAPFSIAMADGRKYMGGADDSEPDLTHHDVAVGAITISSKKDEGETVTGEAGGSSPTLRQNGAKIVDSPSRDEADQSKGVHVEVSDVQTVVDDISLSSSSCSEEEERYKTIGVEGAASSRWQTGSAPCGEETCGKGDRRKDPHSKVSDTMSVCAALGVSSSIRQKEENAATGFERAGPFMRRNDDALTQEHVYCSRSMGAASMNNEQSDDDEYDFQPVKLTRSKRPWITPAIEASIKNVKHTDPLAWFDVHDGEVSLGVRTGGGNKGMFGLRSRKKFDPSRKADNEQEKTESGDGEGASPQEVVDDGHEHSPNFPGCKFIQKYLLFGLRGRCG